MMAYAVIGGDPVGGPGHCAAGGPAGGRKQRARLERVGGYVLSQTLVVAADIENPFCRRRRRRLRIIGVAFFAFAPAWGRERFQKQSVCVATDGVVLFGLWLYPSVGSFCFLVGVGSSWGVFVLGLFGGGPRGGVVTRAG
jgi:hypothetical protein